MKKLPKTVYVYWEQDGDYEYLMSYPELKETADSLGESRLVGVYELKEQVTVTTEVKTTPVSKRTRQSK